MTITAADVKQLREITGVGMMDCKKALQEANGDLEAAVDILRKKGQKVAEKRATREANEGLVVAALSDDGKRGALLELNCETDFVARNEEFEQLAEAIARIVLEKAPQDTDALHGVEFAGGRTVEQTLVEATGKIGEKIVARRFALLESEDGRIVAYIHPGSRLGVLVDMYGNGQVEDAGTDVAMQVAAMNPVATTTEDVPESVKEKEIEIARESARNEGKPDHIIDRIANGKLERYFKDHVLVEQPFVKDSSMSVKAMLHKAGAGVRQFVRFALGE